ncbi:hypothetical protein HMPREF0061_1586, partial [Aerococcus viridans ATCC 11563 = CCUG 4311]
GFKSCLKPKSKIYWFQTAILLVMQMANPLLYQALFLRKVLKSLN